MIMLAPVQAPDESWAVNEQDQHDIMRIVLSHCVAHTKGAPHTEGSTYANVQTTSAGPIGRQVKSASHMNA